MNSGKGIILTSSDHISSSAGVDGKVDASLTMSGVDAQKDEILGRHSDTVDAPNRTAAPRFQTAHIEPSVCIGR